MDWSFVDLGTILVSLLITQFMKSQWTPLAREVDLTAEAFSKPKLPDMIPELPLVFYGGIFCCICFVLVEMRSLRSNKRTFLQLQYYLLVNLGGCIALTVCITEFFKNIAGRPRPFFAEACVSYVEGSKTLCTGDPHVVSEARKSFPSGHTSTAYAFASFLCLFLFERLVLGTLQTMVVKILPPLAPLLLAFYIGLTRTIDYHHHWSDVVAGMLLGSAIGTMCYINCRPRINSPQTLAQNAMSEGP